MRITLEQGHPDEYDIDAHRVSFWVDEIRIDCYVASDSLEIYSTERLLVEPLTSNVIAVRKNPS